MMVIFCLTKWVIVARQHGTYGCLVSFPWTRQRHWRTRLAGFSSFGPWLQTDNTFLRLSSKFARPPFPLFSLVGASAVALVRQWLKCDGIIVPDKFSPLSSTGYAGLIIGTCFIVCSLIWLLHRDPGVWWDDVVSDCGVGIFMRGCVR